MNQLEFSPISEKDEESLDTFSFLHKECQPHVPKHHLLFAQGCKQFFDRFNKSVHNRKSYGFQLLKQFILFSSDQETIEIHYKYMHYELEQGISHLENSYGLKFKLTLGKAFEDIRNFSRKKKVYQNPVYINKLVNVYDKILNLTKQESYRSVIKILAKFIQKQVVTNQGTVSQENKKNTVSLIESLEKQISNNQIEKQALNSNEISEINQKDHLRSTDLKCKKKEDFLKTNKFSIIQQPKIENSHWKQEVQSVDSYEQEPDKQQLRMIVKSMSNQIHDYPQSSISDRKLLQNKSRQTKCMSISVTPARPCSEEYIFQTKKKKSSSSREYEDGSKVVQNVIIVRGSKTYRRQPDRFIRVPVVSDDIKIIQMIPQQSKKREQKGRGSGYNEKINNTRQKQKERPASNGGQRRLPKTEGKYKNNQMNLNFKKHNQQFYANSSSISETHQCLGCKFCEVVRQMQAYRVQRTSRLNGVLKYL